MSIYRNPLTLLERQLINLFFEKLEPRRLFAFTLSAPGDGILQIDGSADVDAIVVFVKPDENNDGLPEVIVSEQLHNVRASDLMLISGIWLFGHGGNGLLDVDVDANIDPVPPGHPEVVVDGGQGMDSISWDSALTGVQAQLNGGGGNDTLTTYSGGGNDTLATYSGGGNDTLATYSGGAAMHGGAGDDAFRIRGLRTSPAQWAGIYDEEGQNTVRVEDEDETGTIGAQFWGSVEFANLDAGEGLYWIDSNTGTHVLL